MTIRWTCAATALAVLSAALFIATAYFDYRSTATGGASPCAGFGPIDAQTLGGLSGPAVIDVYPTGVMDRTVGFGSPICVRVGKLDPQASQKLILYLNAQPLKKVVGRVVDRAKGAVLFILTRDGDDLPQWTAAIGSPPASGRLTMTVGVGPESGEFPTTAKLEFTLFEQIAAWFGLGALVAALVVVVLLGWRTSLLKDAKGKTYSMARCQMLFWLFLITAGFVYVWLVTGDFNNVLTPQALVLLGISGTTALAAVTIDNARGQSTEDSRGLFPDILYEDGGPSIHRIQILAWTLILGAVFVGHVYATFRLPNFDTNLLIMMGISGGFYLGFKAGEK